MRFGEFSWTWYEPEPGKYTFAAIDRFVDLADAAGLRLCLCTPTATPPPWMDELFPDGRLMDMHGRRCLAPRHFWCWNHPGAWAKAEETIATLAGRYQQRSCVWGWQIDNEPNYAEQCRLQAPETMLDWNPHSQRSFATWLERRHGNIDSLNRSWWTNFWSQRVRTWQEAASPRGLVNRGAWLDFMRWREAMLAEQIRRQAEILRRLMPRARLGCNIPETGVNISVNIGQDYWAQAAAGLDWVGVDLYQATGNRGRDVAQHACSLDLLRSAAAAAGADFIVSEFQAGPHVRCWPNAFAGEGFAPDYLRQGFNLCASRGATKVWWFLWRPTLGGAECGMNGLQHLDGSNSPRTELISRLAARPAELPRLRAAWMTRPRAVIHYSRDSLLHRSAFAEELEDINACLLGWHAVMEALGHRVDFISDAQVLAAAADSAALLVVPFTVVAGDELATALAAARAPLWFGPFAAECDEHGRLKSTGVPQPLKSRLGAEPGLWRDVGTMPVLKGWGRVLGWRELTPTTAAIDAPFGNDMGAVLRNGRDAWWSFDLGRHYWISTATQRKFLLRMARRLLRQSAIAGGKP